MSSAEVIGGTRAWLDVPGIRSAGVHALNELDHIAQRLELDPDELATIISLESRWNPGAHNSIRAGGLIGFLPSTLQGLGWTSGPEAFWQLSTLEQLPYVEAFYRPWTGRIKRRGDLYMATFWPDGVGRADDYVIADREGPHEKVWQQNPGLRLGKDGPVTVGGVRAVLSRAMSRAEARPRWIPRAGGLVRDRHHAAGPGFLLILAGIYGIYRLTKRVRRH